MPSIKSYNARFLRDDVRLLLDYIETMEEFLDAEHKRGAETLQEILSELDPDELRDVADTDYSVKGIDLFSVFVRNSTFVSLYSFLESKLIDECRSRKSNEILLDFSDIRAADDMERVKKYFAKVLRINFPSNTREWETIQKYRIIRHCIVHAQSNISGLKDLNDRKKLEHYIGQKPNITLLGDYMCLGKGFCEEACKTIETFLRMVFSLDEPK